MFDRPEVSNLAEQLRSGDITRRDFLIRCAALGMTTATALSVANVAAAQGTSTPEASPVGTPGASPVSGDSDTSITRDEYAALLKEHYALEEIGTPGGQIVFEDTSDIQTLSPILASDVYSGYFTDNIFSGLVSGSAIDGTPVPQLADYWVQEADGVTYTFFLNQNAKWHDGEPVTADDCVFSFDVTVDEKSLSVRRSSVLEVLKEYRAVDEHTFQLVAKQPYATFVNQTAGLVGIIPKHIWEAVAPEDFAADPGSTGQDPSRVIGSGPFMFKEWVLGDHVTKVRNPDYWDPNFAVNIDEFTWGVIKDAASVVASLQTGDIDVCSVPFQQAVDIESNPELRLESYDTASFNWYNMMQDPSRNELFVDPKVRQALQYGLDRDLIAETIYLGYAARADGTQPILSIAYAPDRITTIYNHDPGKARQLREEAGWTDADGDGVVEKDGVKISFECYFSEGSAIYEQQIPYMQQAWREIGVEMIPSAIPFPTLSEMGDTGNYRMRVYGFTWGVDGSQGTMFRCNSVPPAGFNSMHYCNEEYDRLDALQQAELDVEKRIDLLIEQSNIVNDEVAAGIIVFRRSATGSLQTVHNFLLNGYGTLWSLPFIWKDA